MLESTSVLGLLAHADGSARLTSGGTTVLVHVSGPGEVRLRNELIDKAYIEVSFRPAVGVAGTREKLLEHFIKKILDGVVLAALHPRTSISVFVQVIENNGSLLSTALNAVCLALLDGGVPMRTTFMAVDCSCTQSGADSLLFDPTLSDEEAAEANFCLVYGHKVSGLVGAECLGSFTPAQLSKASEQGEQHAQNVLSFVRAAIARKLAAELATSK